MSDLESDAFERGEALDMAADREDDLRKRLAALEAGLREALDGWIEAFDPAGKVDERNPVWRAIRRIEALVSTKEPR